MRIVEAVAQLDGYAKRMLPDISWSDAIFLKAIFESEPGSKDAFRALVWNLAVGVLREALCDLANWHKVRIRRDARTRQQAGRVTHALRTAKPGKLVRL